MITDLVIDYWTYQVSAKMIAYFAVAILFQRIAAIALIAYSLGLGL